MKYLPVVTAFLVLTALFSTSHAAEPILAGLLGWTGDGKTRFCNTYDGTYCGAEGSGGRSQTVDTYVGRRFIDPAGFGDNRAKVPEK